MFLTVHISSRFHVDNTTTICSLPGLVVPLMVWSKVLIVAGPPARSDSPDMNNLQALVISKLSPEHNREEIMPGTYEIDCNCHIKGVVTVAEDTEAKQTVTVPYEELVARVLLNSGMSKEKQLTVLSKSWKELSQEKHSPEVTEMMITVATLKNEVADKLPKQKRSGRVSVKSVKLTIE